MKKSEPKKSGARWHPGDGWVAAIVGWALIALWLWLAISSKR